MARDPLLPALAIGAALIALFSFGVRAATPGGAGGGGGTGLVRAPGARDDYPNVESPGPPSYEGRCSPTGPPVGDFASMVGANPNFAEQMLWWQHERARLGQDAFAWGAFRSHLVAMGAPDPAADPPILFCAFNPAAWGSL